MAQITTESAEAPPLPEVLTLEETAAYLRVSQEDVLEAVRQQRLPGRQVRQQWRFLKVAIQDWLRTSPSQPERIMQLAVAPDLRCFGERFSTGGDRRPGFRGRRRFPRLLCRETQRAA
ncbi:MAG: helix-turn-helix domain-containing protein [Rhodopirellula sp.]|nr:helix-turn-helix domain-containing protein [Rhodopirellula sp.]